MRIIEDDVEQATLELFADLEYATLYGPDITIGGGGSVVGRSVRESDAGYATCYGPDIAPGGAHPERADYSEVVLTRRLREAVERINPHLSREAVDEAVRKVLFLTHPNLIERNHQFHRMLIDGVPVQNRRADGSIGDDRAWLIDFALEKQANNDWLVVNQFTVIEHGHKRRADVVVFVNGLPLGLIELKNPVDENATIGHAFKQLQTYKQEIPALFGYNEVLVISDGTEARAGTLTSDWERFQPWRTVAGDVLAEKGQAELKTLIPGIFDPARFLDLIHNFIVFEVDGAQIDKKMAAYHQFHAVNKAVARTIKASAATGDKRAGVVWHTQGSGKSLSMAFYAGKIIQHPDMHNPTLVILTDRNDLDEQLHSTFARCQQLIRQAPVRAEDRDELKAHLQVAAGGVIFTTIQKFFPENGEIYPQLSDRHNIVFIADEAHRSQYGLAARIVKDKEKNAALIKYGFAKYLRDALPNASFIGFTGTPIEKADRHTEAIFGPYIDVYDIHRAVEDGATVRIFYEARYIKLDIDERERPKIDPRFDDVTEGRELEEKEKLKSKWGRLEAVVGTKQRIKRLARDIVEHFKRRQEALAGKGMIVCMSRRICIELYDAITEIEPGWHSTDDSKGAIKVVMTGDASDGPAWQHHIRSKSKQEAIARRFKDPDDPLQLVIVRDMWLTGFDAPCLHTMYIDKPMQGHGLMQAIARVNRVFKDKPGGLVVDYLGIADALKTALQEYTREDQGETGVDQEQAVMIMQEKYEIVRDLLHGFDYKRFFSARATERLDIIPAAMDHILKQNDGKKDYLQAVTELSKAFALAIPHPRALALREEIGFLQAVRAAFVKITPSDGKTREDLDTAVRQIVSNALTDGGVIDIYKTLGIDQPDIALLSDKFLEDVRNLPHRNLAFELLTKLLNDQIKVRSRRNVVEARMFSERLEQAIRSYQNRTIEAAQVIAEAIELAKEMRDAPNRGADLGLSDEELAFYDALATNKSAADVLGDAQLKVIAQELVKAVRRSITIDWTLKESTRANIRVIIKRLLRKYRYPAPNQEEAVNTIIEQASMLSKDWIA